MVSLGRTFALLVICVFWMWLVYNNVMHSEHIEGDLSGLKPKQQRRMRRALCNRALHTWCQPQFMSLTAIPLVKPCRKPGESKQTESAEETLIVCDNLPPLVVHLCYTLLHSSLASMDPPALLLYSMCLGITATSVLAWNIKLSLAIEVPLGFVTQPGICIWSKTIKKPWLGKWL